MKIVSIRNFVIEVDKYEQDIKLGVDIGLHKHNVDENYHFHIWIDLFKYYIEINIMNDTNI